MKNSITWKSEFAIDNGTIDEEHKELIEIYNRIKNNPRELNQKEAIKYFEEIQYHIIDHFSKEEVILKNVFPDQYIAHKDEHRKLMSGLDEIVISIKSDRSNLYNRFDEILDYLFKVIIGHMVNYDFKMKGNEDSIKKFVNAKRNKPA